MCFVGKKCKNDFVSLTVLQKFSCAFDDCLHLFGLSLNPKFKKDKSRFKKPKIDLKKIYIANLKQEKHIFCRWICKFRSFLNRDSTVVSKVSSAMEFLSGWMDLSIIKFVDKNVERNI